MFHCQEPVQILKSTGGELNIAALYSLGDLNANEKSAHVRIEHDSIDSIQ